MRPKTEKGGISGERDRLCPAEECRSFFAVSQSLRRLKRQQRRLCLMRDPQFGLDFLEQFADRLFFATDMVNTEMVFPLGAWLDEQRDAGRLSRMTYDKICREKLSSVLEYEK